MKRDAEQDLYEAALIYAAAELAAKADPDNAARLEGFRTALRHAAHRYVAIARKEVAV